jgi:amino acid adenylation domain-containing protein
MITEQLLTNLSVQGVKFWAEDGNLKYRAPKGVINSDLRTQLADKKAEILALLTKIQLKESTSTPNLTSDPLQQYVPFPLTDLQQAYAIGNSRFFELGNVSAHYYVEIETSEIDLKQMNVAINALVQRHEALRVMIRADGQQEILEKIPEYQVEIIDLQGQDSETVAAYLQKLRQRIADHGPSIDTWPLFELTIHQLEERKFLLHFSISLIICDALSSGIFFQELFQFYQHKAIPPLEISYRSYGLAIAQIKGSLAYQQSQKYWWQRLDTFPPAPELPLAKQPSSLDFPRFRRWTARLDAEQWQRFQEKTINLGLKPASTLCAAYAYVLNTWSKNSRFSINILYFNRLPLHPQVYKVLGNFSSTVLLEVDCAQSKNFTAHVRALQQQLWQDLEHSSISGVEVLGELNRRQGGSSRAAMPVTFASALGLDSRGQDSSSITNVWTLKDSGLQTPFVLLDHQVVEDQGALVLNWDAVDEVFPSGLMEKMFNAYCRLLKELADDQTAWERNPQLLPTEQLQQRSVINATEVPISQETLHSCFIAQVAQRPQQAALIAAQRQLTYQELDVYSQRVGKWLRQQGAKVNGLVAIVMEKGWEQIVAVLSILKSGAAYLPIDPAIPKENLWYILDNSDVEIVLTQSWLEQKLTWPQQLQILCLDQVDQDQRLESEVTNLPSLQTPLDLAYVIYTSGSTGKPKGVMIDHQGAVNTILDVNRRFDVKAGDRLFAISALSFDLSVYDIFGTLAAGGTIIMPDATTIKDPAQWAEIMVREQVTVWNSAPPLMKLLVEYADENSDKLPNCLKLVLLSGDWIPVKLPEQIKSLLPGVKTISLGGATEASIWSIFHPIDNIDPDLPSIAYGRPLSNQTFHVLDGSLEPCPTWVTGNLYIGGIGLAWGYWRDEAKTAASFIHHPQTGMRLYRTGDLGRYLPDGNIEFLGREDFQVKIRGYRIELGQIEAALSQYPELQALVVTAINDPQGDKQLVAYIVPNSQTVPTSQELRQFLQEKLPEYMIPSTFILLESLPITANGKLDRKALPQPKANSYEQIKNFVAPRNAVEMELVQIWTETLHIHPIGVRDNFFNLGGNSISAVRLMTQIQKHFGQTLPLSTLFQFGTVEQLAQQLNQQQPTRPWSPVVEIQTQGNGTPFFCVHPVGGNVFCYTELTHNLGKERPFYGLQSPGLNPEHEILTSIEEMAACYISAMQTIQPKGPYLIGGWSFGGAVAFEMAQQLHNQNQQVDLLAIIDCKVPNQNLILDEALLAAWFIQDLEGKFDLDLSQLRIQLQEMNSNQQLDYILAQARKLNLVPIDAGLMQIQHLFQVFKTNMLALYSYNPKVYPHEFVLLRAEKQAPEDELILDLGWNSFAPSGLQVNTIPGNHFTIFHEPHVSFLAQVLKTCLHRDKIPNSTLITGAK